MVAFIAALATVLVIVVGTRLGKNEFWTYPAMLIGMPFIYVAFAFYGDAESVLPELFIAVPFVLAGLVACFTSLRNSVYVLALGWLGHGTYDLLHAQLFINAGVPNWYGVYCGVIDIIVTAYLLYIGYSLPNKSWVGMKEK